MSIENWFLKDFYAGTILAKLLTQYLNNSHTLPLMLITPSVAFTSL